MRKVYPVIHFKDEETTILEAHKVKNAGADGIFLISHIGGNEKLIPLAIRIKEEFQIEVGLNFLGENALDTAKVVKENGLDMIWADYCGVSSDGLEYDGHDLADWACFNENIKIFASVAFKYQAHEANPSLAAVEAQKAGFIPTTSGSGTGSAPSVEKIHGMSVAVKGNLAIASGMTCENVNEFKTYLSHILVATGISDDEYHFNIEKLNEFVRLAHED